MSLKHFLAAGTIASMVLCTGCPMMKAQHQGPKAAAKAEKCPPGHVWSDGSCHSQGKGHDPAKKKFTDHKSAHGGGFNKGHDKNKHK